MKQLFAFFLAILFALPASAHPGKTDRHGGHQCLKDCAEWDLFYREYHGHDKDGKPVRIAKKKQAPTPAPAPAPVFSPAVAAPAPAAVLPVAAASVIPVEPEASMLPWLLLALLLMLFLAARRRRRNAEGRS